MTNKMLTPIKQLEFVSELEQLNFSGHVHAADLLDHKWTFYFLQGQIVFATGGIHPIRRWRRHLMAFCPGLPTYRFPWQVELSKLNDAAFILGWEYALLNQWVLHQKISLQQACQMIEAIVTDALFELVQANPFTIETEPAEIDLAPLAYIHASTAAANAERLWEQWKFICLGEGNYLPSHAPVAKHFPLKQLNPVIDDLNFLNRLDGQNTLSDLAVEAKQDLLTLVSNLLPFIRAGSVDLTSVADLPAPIYRQRLFNRSLLPPHPPENPYKGALIACVDDSSFIRNTMEQALTSADFRFVGIEDPLRAIGTLLARKPDLIFLDLVMPQIGGYELCEKLRKLSAFKNTPIVILTGSDSFVKRLRSDTVGASDFLAKPLDTKTLLSVIYKHLARSRASQP